MVHWIAFATCRSNLCTPTVLASFTAVAQAAFRHRQRLKHKRKCKMLDYKLKSLTVIVAFVSKLW